MKSGLQLDQDLRLQRREWWVQRVAWVVFALLLLAIAFGLMGQGPLARAQAATPDGRLQLDYHRFLRRLAPGQLELRLQATGDRVVLQVDNTYLQQVQIENALPQPEHSQAGDQSTRFSFRAQPGGPVRLRLTIRPDAVGLLHGWVAAEGGPPLRFSQFVYP